MLAKRTTTPTVFMGAVALALYGCSLQDYSYLGAKNGGKTNDKTEPPDETEESSTSKAPTSDPGVNSGPDASVSSDTSDTIDTSSVAITSSDPTSTSEPDTGSSSVETPSSSPSSVDETSGPSWVPGPVVVNPNNLLTGTNTDFETSRGAWMPLGGVVLQTTTATAYTGQKSILANGRTQNWEGPSIEMLNVLEHGKSYIVSGWVRSGDDTGQPFHIVRKAICIYDGGIETDDSKIYLPLASTYTDSTWTQIETEPFSMPDCTLQTFVIYFEGPAAMKSFYLDDVVVVEAP